MPVLNYQPQQPRQTTRQHATTGVRRLVVPVVCCAATPLIWLLWRNADEDGWFVMPLLLPLILLTILIHFAGVIMALRPLLGSLRRPPDFAAASACAVPLLVNLTLASWWIYWLSP